MPNSSCNARTTLSFTAPGGDTVSFTDATSAPYQASSFGFVDVPIDPFSQTLNVPFGQVASATLVWIKNRTGQEVAIKINGAGSFSHVLADGASQLIAGGAMPSVPLASMSVTTADAQVAAGTIEYLVVGDSV